MVNIRLLYSVLFKLKSTSLEKKRYRISDINLLAMLPAGSSTKVFGNAQFAWQKSQQPMLLINGVSKNAAWRLFFRIKKCVTFVIFCSGNLSPEDLFRSILNTITKLTTKWWIRGSHQGTLGTLGLVNDQDQTAGETHVKFCEFKGNLPKAPIWVGEVL